MLPAPRLRFLPLKEQHGPALLELACLSTSLWAWLTAVKRHGQREAGLPFQCCTEPSPMRLHGCKEARRWNAEARERRHAPQNEAASEADAPAPHKGMLPAAGLCALVCSAKLSLSHLAAVARAQPRQQLAVAPHVWGYLAMPDEEVDNHQVAVSLQGGRRGGPHSLGWAYASLPPRSSSMQSS